jgi:signal peptidase II
LTIAAKKRYLLIALTVILLDQIAKWLLVFRLPLYGTREILPGFFRLWHVRNPGAVWGFFSGHQGGLVPKIITLLSIFSLLLIGYFFLKIDAHCRLELLSFSLILGGAVGNIIDRLRLGYVVDFLDCYFKGHHWPTFNIADSFISIGVTILILSLWRGKCTQF